MYDLHQSKHLLYSNLQLNILLKSESYENQRKMGIAKDTITYLSFMTIMHTMSSRIVGWNVTMQVN